MICLEFYAVSTVSQLFNATVHITMIPGLLLTSTSPVHNPDTGGPVIVLSPRGKATATSFKNLGLSWLGVKPTTSRSIGGRSNHQVTATVQL